MPQRWFDPHRHTHVALDDAIEQGALFINMLHEDRARGGVGVPAPRPQRPKRTTRSPRR